MPKPRRVRNPLPAADERHQVARVAEGVFRAVVVRHVLRRVAAESEDVLDAGVRIPVEDDRQLVPVVADARQVGDGRQLGLADDPHDQLVRPLAGRAAGPVGDRDERRLERLEAGDGLEELGRCLVRLGRKELEAERGRVLRGRCRGCAWVVRWGGSSQRSGEPCRMEGVKKIARSACRVILGRLPSNKVIPSMPFLIL